MKRFYCTLCKSYRRVRTLPRNVRLIAGPKGPEYVGEGQCRSHTDTPAPLSGNGRRQQYMYHPALTAEEGGIAKQAIAKRASDLRKRSDSASAKRARSQS
jgi:hypothetical protein